MQHPVSIVTGAGSGIGRSIARMLAEKGHHVVLVGRTEQKLAEASDELRAIGPGDVMIVPADVADSEQAASVVDQTIERFGRVDNLVNCAGVAPMIPIERTTEETLEQ
jgi:NAD(P)-dependent dehydrogenase (short-subunit alcohol dehydrogenase family)